MERPRPARVVGHSLWLTVAVAAQLLFIAHIGWSAKDSDPDLGRGAGGALLFVLLLSPVWATASLLVGGLTGLSAGWSARLATRLHGGPRVQVLVGALASGVVAGLLGLAWVGRGGFPDPQWSSFVAALCAAGVVTGGAALLLAQAGSAGPDRSRTLGWSIAALVLASATVLGAGWVWLQTAAYDVVEDCASRLGVDGFRIAWSEVTFPPQLWCLSGDLVQASVPAWADAGLVLGITATVVCTVVAAWSLPGERASVRSLLALCSTVGLVGVGSAALALAQQPPADAVARAQVAATRLPPPSATREPGTGGPPSAAPTVAPETTVTAARSTLASLSRIALRSRIALIWPVEPHVSAAGCELGDETTGTALSLTGRFTTRDPSTVHGPAEMLDLSRANEAAAGELVDDWLASGLLTGADRIHGEWYLGGAAGGPIESAHVGFTDAVGVIQVTTHCASR